MSLIYRNGEDDRIKDTRRLVVMDLKQKNAEYKESGKEGHRTKDINADIIINDPCDLISGSDVERKMLVVLINVLICIFKQNSSKQ